MNILIKNSNQSGFLSIVAVIIIVVLSFISLAAAYQFTVDNRQSAQSLSSAQAYYLALSGIQYGSHQLITNNLNCGSLTAMPAVTGLNGVFNVTCTTNSASSKLSSAVDTTSTTMTVANAAGFAPKGTVLIDNEYINYGSISGNVLQNLTHGVAGTAIVTHNSLTVVVQNQVMITSVGSVPNNVTPTGQRTLEAVFTGTAFALGSGSNLITPAMAGAQSVSLSGSTAAIINSSVTAASSNFPGSTIVTSGGVVFNNGASTKVNSSSGLVVSSDSSETNADIMTSSSYFNSTNLFSKYFNQSKLIVQLGSNQTYTSSNINGVQGKLIWADTALNLTNGMVIGSAASPVVLITTQNINTSGTVTIYGFVYTTQGLALSDGTTIIGGAASEGAINFNNGGVVSFNPAVLAAAGTVNPFQTYQYSGAPTSLQEVIP